MSQRASILKGSFLVALTGVVSYSSGLARNMIFARILTKADFGVVATTAMMMSRFEWVSKMGIGQLLIQSKGLCNHETQTRQVIGFLNIGMQVSRDARINKNLLFVE